MTYTIDVQSTRRFPLPMARAVAAAANEALAYMAAPESAGLTILLADDEYIRQLNQQFRAEDMSTDVLSFPAGDPMPGDAGIYLGDIAISVPTAERQAALKGHSSAAELQLLAIHGVLHLLGHDHLDAGAKTAMWEAQAAILHRMGLENIQPTEDEHASEGDHDA